MIRFVAPAFSGRRAPPTNGEAPATAVPPGPPSPAAGPADASAKVGSTPTGQPAQRGAPGAPLDPIMIRFVAPAFSGWRAPPAAPLGADSQMASAQTVQVQTSGDTAPATSGASPELPTPAPDPAKTVPPAAGSPAMALVYFAPAARAIIVPPPLAPAQTPLPRNAPGAEPGKSAKSETRPVQAAAAAAAAPRQVPAAMLAAQDKAPTADGPPSALETAPPNSPDAPSAQAKPADDAPAQTQASSGAIAQTVDAPAATQTAAPPAVPIPAPANSTGIVAQLSAQVGRRAGAGSSRFDFALEPLGLGRVDVSLKIDASGQLSAALSFDNPGTASEAKSRVGELQQALQQAGFDVSQSGLSFTSGGQGQGGAFQDAPAETYAQPAFTSPSDPHEVARLPLVPAAPSAGGVDITI